MKRYIVVVIFQQRYNVMNLYTRCLFFIVAVGGSVSVLAQTIPYKQINATPLLLNPALTGGFDGNIRGNILYRSMWAGAEMPFSSLHASADAPVYTGKKGDYFGAGLAITQSKAGDGILNNVNGVVGASYHKRFGSDSARAKGMGSELAIGLQGGYAQNYLDMSRMYFTGSSTTPTFVLGPGNSVSSYLVNAGITYSRSVSKDIRYIFGVSVNNLNGSRDAFLARERSLAGLDRRYTFLAGCEIAAGARLLVRPALMYSHHERYYPEVRHMSYIAGSEFLYGVDPKTSLFCGLWYGNGEMMTVSAGVKTGAFRLGLGYDYNISAVNVASSGTGGFEIALTYINPCAKGARRNLPCLRF